MSDIGTRSRAMDSTTEEEAAVPSFAVQHYSVSQIARMWGLSDDSIRRIFEKEADVLVFVRGTKRKYRTLRIPAHVVERVYKRMSSSAT